MIYFNHQACWVLVGLIFLLSACANNIKLREPKPLPEIVATDTKNPLKLKRLWRAYIGLGAGRNDSFAQPILHGDYLYNISASGDLYRVHAQSGKRHHMLNLGEEVYGKGAAYENELFITTQKGNLFVIDLDTQKIKRQKNLESIVLAKPLIHQNLLILQASNDRITALDRQTLEIVWRFSNIAQTDIQMLGNSDPVIVRSVLITGLADGRSIGLDPQSGNLVWQHMLAQDAFSKKTSANHLNASSSALNKMVEVSTTARLDPFSGLFYLASLNGFLGAFSMDGFQPVWQYPIGTYLAPATSPINILIAIDSRHHIHAISKQNGEQIWLKKDYQDRQLTEPLIIDSRFVILGDLEGYLHILNLQTGDIVFQKKIAQSPISPILFNHPDQDSFYIMDQFGYLQAFQLISQ